MSNVYFISDAFNIKIGKSDNPEDRLLQLQVGNARPLRILYLIPNVPEEMELHTHSVCMRYNVQGEWFKPSVVEHLKRNPWYAEHIKAYIPTRPNLRN